MRQKVVRYGLLSTSQIGINAHLPASRESKSSQIVSISSRAASKARAAADEHGIDRWYGSYEEQLADPEMDAVINALPISMHCEWTVKAAEAGKHILCEKPLATSAKDCARMIDAARSNNVVLVEGFTHRWNPHLRKARALVADGAIGQVVTVSAVGCSHRTRPADYGSIRYSAELEGGALREVGSYAVYAARFVLRAEPIRVHGVGFDSGGWGVYTTFCGVLEFGNGVLANVTSSMEHSSFRFRIAIDGREGRIEIPSMFDDSGPVIIKGVEGRDEQTITTPAPNRFTAQLDEFSECVLTGKAPEFPAEDGLRNSAVLEALHESASSGRSVTLDLEAAGSPRARQDP